MLKEYKFIKSINYLNNQPAKFFFNLKQLRFIYVEKKDI